MHTKTNWSFIFGEQEMKIVERIAEADGISVDEAATALLQKDIDKCCTLGRGCKTAQIIAMRPSKKTKR